MKDVFGYFTVTGFLHMGNYWISTIHQNNFLKLVIKMFKTYTGITPQIMNEVFPRN